MSNYAPGHRVTSYEQARDVVRAHGAKRRDGSYSVPLGHATTVRPVGLMTAGADPLDAPSYAVRYHDTDVVTYYRNGVIALDHAGWLSTTTALRWYWFTPRELRVNNSDILARRIDRDPRIIVSDITVSGGFPGREVFVSRADDRRTYLTRTRDGWQVAPLQLISETLNAA